MMFAPLEGWRHVEVTDRHTAVDYARILQGTIRYPLSRSQEESYWCNVELNIVDPTSGDTIGRTLKKTISNRGFEAMGHPADANAAFVAGMEVVLEVYQRPHDPEGSCGLPGQVIQA